MPTDPDREAFEETARGMSLDDQKALLQHMLAPRPSNLFSSPDLGWYVIRVELLSGCAERFEPPPGRDILISPQHTFRQLAEAINASFGRWDLGHLYQFHMPDGSRIGTVVEDDDDEMFEAARRKLGRRAEGDVFTFEFDFGDVDAPVHDHRGGGAGICLRGSAEGSRGRMGVGSDPRSIRQNHARRLMAHPNEPAPSRLVVSDSTLSKGISSGTEMGR